MATAAQPRSPGGDENEPRSAVCRQPAARGGSMQLAQESSKMKPTRNVTRRSFLGTVAGASLAGGALLAVAGSASSQSRPRMNNAGRRIQGTITDGDKNPADATGPRGCTDYDMGRNADGPGSGRGTRLNDNDRELGQPRARQYGDPTNCGRRRSSGDADVSAFAVKFGLRRSTSAFHPLRTSRV